ncbi:MAG TPA: PAS domain S-box protein, partial [bacterium (Candidatus Stahlbacteria)]|nr:PAS domain S-box protein [Candidatus Stahlbacteria bacterium]
MEEKLRKTGIDVIGNVCWGTHLCLFYQAKEDLINILAPYFKAGLENNEFCMWVTSESLSEKEAKKALREAMSNFHRYLKRGQIEIVPYTEWYLKDGTFNLQRVLNAWIDKLNQALAKGYDGIRVTSNTAWLKKRDWKSFVDYEKEVNNAIDKYRMLAICTYPLDKCGASEVIDVVSHHQFALIKRQGNWELIESGEHKRAEERILHSENKYRMLVEQSPDGIFSVDLNGRILSANRAIYEKLGYTEEELLSMNIWDIVPTSYRQVFEERIKHILKGEHLNFPAEYEVYSKTGNRYWVEIRSTPLFRNGQVVGFQGIARDITERKQAEEALRESEAKCRALVEASSDGIISMNEKGKITFWNKAVEQMFGYQRAEILGKPVTMLMPKEYKERHREAVRSFMKKPRRLKRTIEVEALKKNGKRFPIELSFSSYKSGDTFTFIAIVRDITERKKAEKELKKSEEKYRSLFDNANDAILIADPSTGIILDANKASEKLMGLPREKLIGMHQTEIHPLEEAMRYAEIFKEHVKKGKAIQQDVYVQHQKGYRIPVDIRANVIQIGNKKVIQGVFRDIRERKKVEERERRHRNELETLFQTATLLNSGLDLDEVLEKIVDSISKVIGFHHCSLRLVDKDRNVLVTKVVRGVGKEYWKYRKIIPSGKHKYDLSGLTAMDGKPHYVRDLMTLDYPKEMKKNVIKKYNLKSYLCIPIKVEKEVLGVFSIMTQAYREFSEDEMRLLFTFAEQAAQAIIRARTLDLLKESEAKYRTLFEHTGTAMTIVEEDTTISLVNS